MNYHNFVLVQVHYSQIHIQPTFIIIHIHTLTLIKSIKDAPNSIWYFLSKCKNSYFNGILTLNEMAKAFILYKYTQQQQNGLTSISTIHPNTKMFRMLDTKLKIKNLDFVEHWNFFRILLRFAFCMKIASEWGNGGKKLIGPGNIII